MTQHQTSSQAGYSDSTGNPLPLTGTDVFPLAGFGALLLALGVAYTIILRKLT